MLLVLADTVKAWQTYRLMDRQTDKQTDAMIDILNQVGQSSTFLQFCDDKKTNFSYMMPLRCKKCNNYARIVVVFFHLIG